MVIRDPRVKKKYLERYPVDTLFSFPVRELFIIHKLQAGEFLNRSDADHNRLYFLVEGKAKTYIIHPNGTETLLSFPSPGTLMGDMDFVGAQMEMYLVEAVMPCIAIELPLHICREQVMKDEKFLFCLCQILANKLYKEDVRLSAAKSFPVKPRLAEFILMAQTDGIFWERLTETAKYLGCSYRHLQRAMAEFCEQGILKRAGRGYEIINSAPLEAWVADINPIQGKNGFLRLLPEGL